MRIDAPAVRVRVAGHSNLRAVRMLPGIADARKRESYCPAESLLVPPFPGAAVEGLATNMQRGGKGLASSRLGLGRYCVLYAAMVSVSACRVPLCRCRPGSNP